MARATAAWVRRRRSRSCEPSATSCVSGCLNEYSATGYSASSRISSAPLSVASASARSLLGNSATASRIGCENSFPITAAVWSSCFSRSDRRSIRADSTVCTDVGTTTSATGLTRR